MTSPRHQDPQTAAMPALPRVPRHAHHTGQQRAVQPWERTEEQPFWIPTPAPEKRVGIPTTGHRPERATNIESVGWWKRFVRWLKGTEEWKR